tara:strand:- start:2075 stop:2212 length:138 start_codon:yes stop_codon:yes gene_type:complete
MAKKTKSKKKVEKKKVISKIVEKDSHVQFITARPKTKVNQRERNN